LASSSLAYSSSSQISLNNDYFDFYILGWNPAIQNSFLKGVGKAAPLLGIGLDIIDGVDKNLNNGASADKIVKDAVVDLAFGLGGAGASLLGSMAAGAALGSIVPGAGTLVGAAVGLIGGLLGASIWSWLSGGAKENLKNGW
jgi:hypothetical protein